MGVERSQVHFAGWSDASANSRSFAAGFLCLASDLFRLTRDLMFSLQASRAAASMNSWLAEWPTTLTQLQELVSRLYFLLNRDLVFLIQTSCIALTAAVIISWFAEWRTTLTELHELSGGCYVLLVRDLCSLQATCVVVAAAIVFSWLAVTKIQELDSCLYFLLVRHLVFFIQTT